MCQLCVGPSTLNPSTNLEPKAWLFNNRRRGHLTNVIIVYGTYVNWFAFNQRSCVNWKGMKLHRFGQNEMNFQRQGWLNFITHNMVKQLSCLKKRHIWQLDWMLPMFFSVRKFHCLGTIKMGMWRPKDSFGGKCTKTPYVKGKSYQISIFNH